MKNFYEKLKENKLLIIILSGSFLIKLFLLIKLKHMVPAGDEVEYLWHGLRIARGETYEIKYLVYDHFNSSHWGPGYIYFIVVILKLFHEKIFFIKLIQILLNTISACFLYVLAERIFNKPVALLSVFIFSAYPTLIAFTHYLYPETLYIFLLIVIIYLLTAFSTNKKKRNLL